MHSRELAMGLSEGMTTEELTSGISRPRNREIMRIYKDMELVEQLGSGMNRIMKVYAPDIFKISPNFFHVVLYFDNEHINDRENVPENVTERQKQILAFIEKNNKITANELALELAVTSKTINRDIGKLKSLKIIERIGGDKGGHWKVIKQTKGEM